MTNNMLHEVFTNLFSRFTHNEQLINSCWIEIDKKYSGKRRHYHTLSHLNDLLNQLGEVKDLITDWDTILFTLFYHDIIYNTLKTDNEEQSAKIAAQRMKSIQAPVEMIADCTYHILATKNHAGSNQQDTDYFLDADLSILGQDRSTYITYYHNVRKEYFMYPDLIYKQGRKKVLQHFLNMPIIYKTVHFHNKFELKARQNLQCELEQL